MRNALAPVIAQMRRNRFFADVASLMGSRIFIMVLSFVSGVIVARALGPENKGIVTTLLVIPGLIQSFAELGLRQSTTYFLGKRIYDDQSVISTISLLTLIMSSLGILIVLLFYAFSGLLQQYGWVLTTIPVLLLPSSLVASYGIGVLLAKQRIQAISVATVLEPLLNIGLIGGLFLVGLLTVQSVLLVTVLAAMIAASYIVGIVRTYGHLRPHYDRSIVVSFLRMGFIYALALFILSLGYRFDIVLLQRLSTSREVGIYSVGVGIAQLLWLLPTALTTVNFARSAAATNALGHAQKTAMIMRVTLWGSLLPCVALFLIAPWLIVTIYGEAYAESGAVVQAIMLGIWMALIFKVLNSDLAGRGKPHAALWVYGFALVLNIAFNLAWIPLYGSLGAAWASSVSYTVGAMIFAVAYARMSDLSVVDLLLPRVSDFRYLKVSVRP